MVNTLCTYKLYQVVEFMLRQWTRNLDRICITFTHQVLSQWCHHNSKVLPHWYCDHHPEQFLSKQGTNIPPKINPENLIMEGLTHLLEKHASEGRIFAHSYLQLLKPARAKRWGHGTKTNLQWHLNLWNIDSLGDLYTRQQDNRMIEPF